MKWCGDCQAELPLDAFGVDRKASDGKRAHCKRHAALRQAESWARLHAPPYVPPRFASRVPPLRVLLELPDPTPSTAWPEGRDPDSVFPPGRPWAFA